MTFSAEPQGRHAEDVHSSVMPDFKTLRLDAYLAKFDLSKSKIDPKALEVIERMLQELNETRADLVHAREDAERHERLAHEDAFMPIGNRRAFVRELTRLISLTKRHGVVSSIVYIDLNGMKLINDRFGHNAGDAALMQVARTLCNQVRESDIVARLGGDEFGVLLVRTDGIAADKKAASLVEAIGDNPLEWEGAFIPLRAAYGAYAITGEETVASALEAADQAMYVCKKRLKALAAQSS